MRSWFRFVPLALLLSVGLLSGSAPAADKFPAEGKWKLNFLMQDLDLVIVEVKAEGEDFQVSIVDASNQIGKAEAKKFSVKDGVVELLIHSPGIDDLPFKGKPVAEGDDAGAVLGVVWLRGNALPARLDKTDAEKVQAPKPNPAQQAFIAAFRIQDPKEKLEKLLDLAKTAPAGLAFNAYGQVFQSAEAAGLDEEEVRKHLQTYLASATKYGPEWESQCRSTALQGILGRKPYSALGLELAEQNRKELKADASLEQQANALQALARAARAAEKDELAATTEKELVLIDAKLDEEYHQKVPPFAPEKFEGRSNPEHNRVVVFELFTGAQCPPCVAADVAFDAILSTYQHTELIALQYHLHIPGPDPLTNADSETRAKFYSVRGTPSTYFNGITAAGGGGGMPQSKSKYDQFRGEIDKQLAGGRSAQIDLKLERKGEKIAVTAVAQAEVKKPAAEEKKEKDAGSDEKGQAKDEGKAGTGSQLRLRLVLTEESIRYVGGNKLRFHHHVVRGFPGGVEGLELTDGAGKLELTVDLNDVRKVLSDYVETYGKARPFANSPPKLDFKGLALVALIQDDSDKSILHAVQLPVPEAP
ncbi:MAG: hypothetical protein JSS02_12025 [Planctomycetes bacterium]|nr:hypothetical protein [Planctomycetota bacterium]